jgi:hypothetical protein
MGQAKFPLKITNNCKHVYVSRFENHDSRSMLNDQYECRGNLILSFSLS